MTELMGKRVLVTGGSGFLGKAVTHQLRIKKAHVYVPMSDEFDLVRLESVRLMYEVFRPDLVIHLAAVVGGIGANRARPADFLYQNLLMGTQVLHEAYRKGVGKCVSVGTVCAYPANCPVPFKEEDLWSGYPEETNAPYGLAKKMLLVQSKAYRDQYGFNSSVLFPVNLYGPWDNFDLDTSHVIPAMIRKFHEAKETGMDHVRLWGDGSPSREFLYVDDAARAVIMALESYDRSDPINLGTGREIVIRDLASLIRDLVGFCGRIVWECDKPNGQSRRCLDVTKAEEEFGFRATTSLEEGLVKTYRWYLENRGRL